MSVEETDAGIWTWANLVTLIRLCALPVFVMLLFKTDHRALAAWLFTAIGATDWVDGYLARKLNQVSTIGKIIDPTADRILVITGLLSTSIAHGVPWWFSITVLVREVLVSGITILLALLGAARIDVIWWGKVSTFILMGTFPLFLLTTNPHLVAPNGWQNLLREGTWLMGGFGLVLSWIVLLGYVRPALEALRAGRQGRQIL